MLLGLQIIGLLFGVGMLYLTFLHFRRNEYQKADFVLWAAVWLFFIFVVMFPSTMYGLMETLKIERTVDFITIGGGFFFSMIIFRMYVSVKRTKNKVEEVVRKVAIEKAIVKKR